MKRCVNCKYAENLIDGWVCKLKNREYIPYPHFMGEKCECYEKTIKFEYPKKDKDKE